jgi:hypothetical protein
MASKWDKYKILKTRKARTNHKCANCNSIIKKGKQYYVEGLNIPVPYPLLEVRMKKFCAECYTKYGNNLLKMRMKTLGSSLKKFT